MSTKRLLLIDDDLTMLNSLKAYLDVLGVNHDSTDDPIKGSDLYEEKRHSLVLCDLQMPRANGLDVLNYIKAIMINGEIDSKLYLITGVEKVPESMLKDGFNDVEVIYKRNFNPEVLKKILIAQGFIN